MKMRSLIRSLQRSVKSVNYRKPSVMEIVGPAIGALAVGLLAGAGIALLLAPTSGGKLREQIENKLSGAKSRLLSHGENATASTMHRANASTSSLEHRS